MLICILWYYILVRVSLYCILFIRHGSGERHYARARRGTSQRHSRSRRYHHYTYLSPLIPSPVHSPVIILTDSRRD